MSPLELRILYLWKNYFKIFNIIFLIHLTFNLIFYLKIMKMAKFLKVIII